MKCNFIHIKLRDKSNINLQKSKILELFELSLENSIINLKYNQNKKESSSQNLEIIYYKKYIQKNVIKIKKNLQAKI